MKKHIKRLSLALVAIGLSAPVFADTGSPFDVTVPNQQGGFTVGADALYMRGTAPNLTYAPTFGPINLNGNTISTTGSLQSVDTTYQWGFDATIGYRIPNTGNDVTVNWTYLNDLSNSDSTTPMQTTGAIFTNPSNSATGTAQFDYNAVDVDLGQNVNLGDYFTFHLFAGGRWADVEQKTNAAFAASGGFGDGTGIAANANIYQDSEFKGIGPQIGFTGRACLGYGFGLDAGLTTSLLVGDVDSSANVQGNINSISNFTTTNVASVSANLDSNNRDRVVPALDGNIGLDYTYAFNNADRSTVVVQAGYKVINYFGVTNNIVSDGPNGDSDVSFDGPYAGVKVNI